MPTQTWSSIRSHMEQLPPAGLRAIVNGRNRAIWTEQALDVAEEVLRERDDAPAEAPAAGAAAEGRCARCGEETIHGWIALRASLLSFLVVGLSWSHVVLERSDGAPITLLRQGSGSAGEYCPACGAVTIDGPG